MGINDRLVPPSVSRTYPNPFHTQTAIEFILSEPGDVKIIIWDERGKLVDLIQDKNCDSGTHIHLWNGMNQAGNQITPGLYLYRIETESGEIYSGRMICTGDSE